MGNALPKLETPTREGLRNFIRAMYEWSRSNTRVTPETRSYVDGPQLSQMGRSGASLEFCVLKRGLHVHEEAVHAQLLGPAVCPRIPLIGTDLYVMEYLSPVPMTPELPLAAEAILANCVWDRSPIDCTPYWWQRLFETTGIGAPDWTWKDVEQCLTHGDPTFANMMSRPIEGVNRGQMLLCDPVPPGRRVPQIREVDQAKILQSMLGWEAMIGGRCIPSAGGFTWDEPDFLQDGLGEAHAQRLMFWTGISMLRCQQHLRVPEQPAGELDTEYMTYMWCDHIKGEMLRAAGI